MTRDLVLSEKQKHLFGLYYGIWTAIRKPDNVYEEQGFCHVTQKIEVAACRLQLFLEQLLLLLAWLPAMYETESLTKNVKNWLVCFVDTFLNDWLNEW